VSPSAALFSARHFVLRKRIELEIYIESYEINLVAA
jgi:hypothetical protein